MKYSSLDDDFTWNMTKIPIHEGIWSNGLVLSKLNADHTYLGRIFISGENFFFLYNCQMCGFVFKLRSFLYFTFLCRTLHLIICIK